MPPFNEIHVPMNPHILRFDDAEEITTPGMTSSASDEPDQTVLEGPKCCGRSASERELLRNRFDADEPRDPLARG